MSIVPDFPWNKVLCDRFLLRWNDLTTLKLEKARSDLRSRVLRSWQDLGHISRNFGEINGRIE